MLGIFVELPVVEEKKRLDGLNEGSALDGVVFVELKESSILVEQLQSDTIDSVCFHFEFPDMLFHQIKQLHIEVRDELAVSAIQRIVLSLDEQVGGKPELQYTIFDFIGLGIEFLYQL